jgi:hypothetical protein
MRPAGVFRGAYGLRVEGVDGAEDLLGEADESWPRVELMWRLGDATLDRELVSDTQATLRLRTGGRIELDRQAERAEYVVPRPLSAEELVHPYLVPVAAVMSLWQGRESIHAGAFVGGGGVWGVVGDQESGKSSTLAALALDGASIISDDLLALDGVTALPGPRAIDLREDAARRLGVGSWIGVAGTRERWRLRLGPVPRKLMLRGWVHLAWGERVEARPLSGRDRIARLLDQRAAHLPSPTPEVLLDLASLPAWEVRRPREWSSLREAATCLRQLAGD